MIYNKLTLIIGILTASISLSHAQNMPQKYGNSITPTELKKYLSVLAHDSLEGRETGMPGQVKAANYIRKHYQSIGIKPNATPDYFQNYPLSRNAWKNRTLTINAQNLEFGKDFYCFYNIPDVAINEPTAEILYIGYGTKTTDIDHLYNANLENKIVIVQAGDPKDKSGKSIITGTKELSAEGNNYRAKIKKLQSLNPKLIIFVDEDFDKNLKRYSHYFMTPNVTAFNSKQAPVVAPTLFISNDKMKAIFKNFAKLKKPYQTKKAIAPKVLKASITAKIDKDTKPVEAQNVLGFLPGTDLKDEILVVSAHYDHIGIIDGEVYNGADDDGSGTSAVMAIARAFKQAADEGKGPRRSILFLNVSGEEKGLLGSEYYASHPIYPLSSTIADLNIDMIGRVDTAHTKAQNYIYVIGADKLSTELNEINKTANDTYTKLNLDYTFNAPNDPNRFYYRSDHYNFAKNNVPVIFYFNGVHEDYHQKTDEIEKIDFELMTKRTQLVFYTAWQLANQTKRIEVNVKNDFPADR